MAGVLPSAEEIRVETAQRRHFRERVSSGESPRARGRKVLRPPASVCEADRPRGVRRVPPPRSTAAQPGHRGVRLVKPPARGEERPVVEHRVRRQPPREGPPPETPLEEMFGARRRRVETLEERRNGIPCRTEGDGLINNIEYSDGYYAARGLVPSADWAASERVTATRRGTLTLAAPREGAAPPGRPFAEVLRERLREAAVRSVCDLPAYASDSEEEREDDDDAGGQ